MTDKFLNSIEGNKWKDLKCSLKDAVIESIDRGLFNEKGIFRIEEEISCVDPLLWLKGQNSAIRVFFADRDKELIAAGTGASIDLKGCDSGVHAEIDIILENSSSDVKFFGGEAFPVHKNSNEWEGFGSGRFIVPQFELGIRDGKGYFACNIHKSNNKDDVLGELDKLGCSGSFDTSISEQVSSVSEPAFNEWSRGIESVLRNIRLGYYDKIVLAVRRTLVFKSAPDPFFILRELLKLPNSRYHFLFDFGKGIFTGSSPERLYVRNDLNLISEAVAGTVSRGADLDEDSALGFRLMTSDKDIREHGFVVKAVKEKLEQIGMDVTVSKDNNLLKLAEGQHLKKTIKTSLKEECSEYDILNALHPTPAVGGYPGKSFLEDIKSIETFDRGWYAGAVGYRGFEKSDFAVGIRSLIACGNTLHLYGGVGVVDGSEPHAEWEESSLKLSNFLKILDKNKS